MNISLGQHEFNILSCTLDTIADRFSGSSIAPLIVSWFIGLSSVTRFRQSKFLISWRHNFLCEIIYSKKLIRVKSELFAGVFLLHNRYAVL